MITAKLRAPHRSRTEWPDRNVSAAAVLTMFWSHPSRVYVSASLVTPIEMIAAWKLRNEANRIRVELKYRNGEYHG